MKRRKQPSINTSKKVSSLAFFVAIPVSYLLLITGIWAVVSLTFLIHFDFSRFALFAVGGIIPCGALLSSRPTYFKTLIHELKHAALVVLSGNKLTDINVSKDSGLVKYEVFENRTHFGPFILLAPYFFPIFSLPMLIACIALELYGTSDYYSIAISLLGLALATDLISAYLEFHPHQTDPKRIFGGKIIVVIFLLGLNLLWFTVCVLYVIDGLAALQYAALRLVHFGLSLIGTVEQ